MISRPVKTAPVPCGGRRGFTAAFETHHLGTGITLQEVRLQLYRLVAKEAIDNAPFVFVRTIA